MQTLRVQPFGPKLLRNKSNHSCHRVSSSRSNIRLVPRAEGKVVREYREDDDSVVVPKTDSQAAQRKAAPQPRLSKEMEKKLRQEYIGFGGSANQAMGGNYFLYVILFVAGLAILSWLTGAI